MALTKSIQLPPGWTERTGGPMADITRMGRPGRRHLQDNDPYVCWQFSVTYKRSEFEETEALRFDDVYAFFLVTKGYSFLVDDVKDNLASSNRGRGVILLLDGVYRPHKRYQIAGEVYDHPITRPLPDIALSQGFLMPDGTVTGINNYNPNNPPTWTGGFLRPMIFADNGLSLRYTPDGMIEAISVALEENFEF